MKNRIVGLLFCLSLLGLIAWTSYKPNAPQESGPQIVNKTQSFQVINIVEKDGDYRLTIKNVSSKAINGYSIGTGRNSIMDVDLTIGERVIAPQAIIEERIPVSNVQTIGGSTQPTITILAALFEDQTGEGDPQTISKNRDRRAGIKKQLERILPLIDVALNTSESELPPAALKNLQEQISSLPEAVDENLPAKARSGLHSAKQDSLTKLQRIDSAKTSVRAELIKFKESIEKRIARL